jgi:hypothetical protein
MAIVIWKWRRGLLTIVSTGNVVKHPSFWDFISCFPGLPQVNKDIVGMDVRKHAEEKQSRPEHEARVHEPVIAERGGRETVAGAGEGEGAEERIKVGLGLGFKLGQVKVISCYLNTCTDKLLRSMLLASGHSMSRRTMRST